MAGPVDDKPAAPAAPRPAGRAPTPTLEDGGPREKTTPARTGGAKALIGLTISDRYRIERLLGEGGMGAVYQAEHTLMRKRMAIKVLHPEMTRLPEVVARFEREAMAAAHMDHPHVVTATDFGKLEDGSFFLALEFVEGKSLREIIAAGRLDLGRALHIGRQIAAALQRAHALKIVHRDLKPENVMLVDRDGDSDFVKVLDFGIAKVQMGELGTSDRGDPSQPVLTQAGMVYGTPEYMAPEQALGQPVDPRADLYALGIILYEMCTGLRPFEADSKVALLGMQVTAPVPPMVQKCADCNVPIEVETLVGHLLRKEASERVGDAREVIEAISVILAQLTASGRVDSRYAPAPASGMMTNPGLISGITPSPPELAAGVGVGPAYGKGPASEAGRVDGLLSGRGWLVAMGAGILGLALLMTTIVYVLKGRDTVATGMEGGLVSGADGGTVGTGDLTLDERVKEAIGMIDRGDYGSGIKRLEDLGEQAQGREDVHRALFAAYTSTDRPRESMREVGLILKANPSLNLREELKLRLEVRDTALKEGTKDPTLKATVDDAFALLDGPMGAVGLDDLWDIAYGNSGTQFPKAAERAQKAFAKMDRTRVPAPIQVALDLHAAGVSCAAKNHFERAQKDGDERALALLRRLTTAHNITKPSGIRRGGVDLLACLHDGQLARTIAAIEERLKNQKKK